MAISEFELIDRYFSQIGTGGGSQIGLGKTASAAAGVALGVGDDCALLDVPAGHQLAVSADTLVAGVHFPLDADPGLIARRALRVNLSDLAAMGAQPLGFTLALTLPGVDPDWLARFAAGLRVDADQFAIPLVGGDTTRGQQLVITVQVMGSLPRGAALTRHGAEVGDRVFVSGALGGAAAALAVLATAEAELSPAERRWLEGYWLPEPRLALGMALRKVASGAIDISDGIAGDLGHILKRSNVGARIDAQRLPLASSGPDALALALQGGDDYELCFTVPPRALAQVEAIEAKQGLALVEIGCITAEPGLRLATATGEQPIATRGYTHF